MPTERQFTREYLERWEREGFRDLYGEPDWGFLSPSLVAAEPVTKPQQPAAEPDHSGTDEQTP